jgi:hypothetical protein
MKNAVFWGVTPCILTRATRRNTPEDGILQTKQTSWLLVCKLIIPTDRLPLPKTQCPLLRVEGVVWFSVANPFGC